MKKKAVVAIVLLALLARPSPARADIAPPSPPPGSNVQPGTETTQVRMLAETVLIEVRPGSGEKDLGLARVTADFTMQNTGDNPETMAARFPIAADDGWGKVNLIADLRIRVAGQTVPTRRITGKDPNHMGSQELPWAEFDVTFPPHEEVAIQAQYTLQGGGEYPFSQFTYILSTGAGWKDTIGSADIIVQLPYEASTENVLAGSSISAGTTSGGRIDGTVIRWHYDNLEPTYNDNFEIDLVTPSTWQKLLAEQENVALHPSDGESWGRIGMLCKQMAYSSRGKGFRAGELDAGAAQLYQEAVQAYDKAVTLLPKDALWHAGYAELLGYHAFFEGLAGVNTDEEAAHSFSELQLAQQLAPDNPQVQQISEELSGFFPGGTTPHQSQSELTAKAALNTPAPSQTAVSEANATPATEIIPSSTAEARPTSLPSKPTSTLCGSALLIPVTLLLGLAYIRPGKWAKIP